MLMNRFFQLMAALVVLALYTTEVSAQHEIHRGPPFIDPNGYDPDYSQPFIEPMTFDPDFQFFAPAGVDRLGGEIEASIGWFATYDRTYTYVTRPQDEPSYTQGDFTWGNRFNIGYMTAEDHGWHASFMNIDGPNSFRVLEAERINVFLPDDTVNGDPDAVDLRGGGAGGGGQQPAAVQPGFPLRDRNDPVTQDRTYRVHESINEAQISGFELNKTFRIDPLHYQSIVEPFFGFRYTNVDDFFHRDVYERFDTTTGALVYTTAVPGVFPPAAVDLDDVSTEQLTSLRTHFDNQMFGGQIGLRWFKQKSRWNLSGEVRAFALQNFQSINRTIDVERTVYDGGVGQPDVDAVFYQRQTANGHASEFVIGTELRAEAAYNVTKYIRIRTGVEFMDFGRGIGRGNDLLLNDQDLLLVGANLGFEVNR
jgi:hypothetical protein